MVCRVCFYYRLDNCKYFDKITFREIEYLDNDKVLMSIVFSNRVLLEIFLIVRQHIEIRFSRIERNTHITLSYARIVRKKKEQNVRAKALRKTLKKLNLVWLLSFL